MTIAIDHTDRSKFQIEMPKVPEPESQVRRAIVIAQPWADFIVTGQKIWEIRKKPFRLSAPEPVGIIAKGTGTIIGVVEFTGCLGPFTAEELAAHKEKHCVKDDSDLRTYCGDSGAYAWTISSEKRLCLAERIRYEHPSGAQSFVSLEKLPRNKEVGQIITSLWSAQSAQK